MKIEYVSHACLYVQTPDSKIVIDPWFNGPAYQQQWFVFPKPVNTDFIKDVDCIVITHGHEDHLHADTLKMFPRETKILLPYTWKDSAVKHLNELGFYNIQECPSYESVELTPQTKLTFVANSLDSIAVVESNGEVMMDLNDALNAHHKSIIKLLTAGLKKKWNKIDYLVCGLGGAGYFPNMVHYNGKNDSEIGLLRERFLAHKFCEIVQELKPRNVVSFVPGFALMDGSKQWINETRFDREKLGGYYTEHFEPGSSINFLHPYPGDLIENAVKINKSPYYGLFAKMTVTEIIKQQYAAEMEQHNFPDTVSKERLKKVYDSLKTFLPEAASAFNPEVLKHVDFDLYLIDAPCNPWIHIYYDKGKINCERNAASSPGATLRVETKTRHLEFSMNNEWGGDVFMIGYAADIYVLNENALKNNLDIVSLRLLSRFPFASGELIRNPARGLKFIFSNPALSALLINNKLAANGNPNKLPHNERSHWINRSKCEVCMACDLPLLSYSLGETLEEEVSRPMKTASIHELKDELKHLPAPKLLELCTRLARFKKENKELLTYLLFEEHDEQGYIEAVKNDIDLRFSELEKGNNLYLLKKSMRKILRNTNKYIRYTGSKTVEIQLLLYFCSKLKQSGIAIRKSTALTKLYEQQLKKINASLTSLHEDLQYDYLKELEGLGI